MAGRPGGAGGYLFHQTPSTPRLKGEENGGVWGMGLGLVNTDHSLGSLGPEILKNAVAL